jgi:ComF family protein
VAVVPVPLHRARLRQRGYDQALELARPLARALGLPLLDHALTRTRATAPQSQLDAAQRRLNLQRAFEVRGNVMLPAHVVLVDDVMTTGATLHAAAVALKRAGAQRVDAWVCARVP